MRIPWLRNPKRGDRDADRNPLCSAFAQRGAHHRGSRSVRGGQLRGAEHAQANEVHGKIQRDDAGDSQQQAARKIAARIAHLSRDEARGLPAAVRKGDRNHRGADGFGETQRCRPVEQRQRDEANRRPAITPTTTIATIAPAFSSISSVCTLLPARTPKQLIAVSPSSAAAAIEAIAGGQAADLSKISRERDRNGGHPAGLRHQQQHPAVEKRDRRMVGLAQVEILASSAGQPRGEFRPDERAEQREQASQRPAAENQEWGVHAKRDDVRVDENSGADDATHHDHGGIEDSQTRSQRCVGHFSFVSVRAGTRRKVADKSGVASTT